MKAIIPLAGKGTRLRPHTYVTPKPLLSVGGRPVMSYILDDLVELGVDEIVFVVGYLGDVIQEYISEEYPELTAHFVVQEVQDGTAGAVKLAAPFIDGDVLIVFVDTLFDADLSLTRDLPEDWAGGIWAKEVEDYQRFGVIVTGEDGAMTRIVEKPKEPVSKLANIGLYYIRDSALLFEGIDETLAAGSGPAGEYYLTDAFQYMVDQGAKIQTAPVAGWYDCGKKETLLETNQHLLETDRGTVDPSVSMTESYIHPPVRIEVGAVLEGSEVGPNVTLAAGVHLVNARIRDSIVGREASVEGSELQDSLVGSRAKVSGFRGTLNIGDDSEVTG